MTEEDFAVPEFATRGETKTDQVMRVAPDSTIHKFMRFGPGYIVGEDAEALFAVVRPILEEAACLRNTRVTLRFGPPEEDVPERVEVLDA